MEQKRVYLWDNLKFVLIVLVVMGHFAEQYMESTAFKSVFIFIYAFHMPLFIFTSGLFHKNENIPQKVFTYIALGYVYKFVIFLLRNLLGENPKFYVFTENGIPWYLFALAAFILIAYLLRNVNQKFVFVISILLACFAGYDQSIGDFLVLSRIIVFYPFYQLGILVDKEKLLALASRPKLKISSGVIFTLWGLLCLFMLDYVYLLRPLFTGRNPFIGSLYQYGCLYRLLHYIISIVLGFALICLIPSRKLPVISVSGKRTLQVYFWHRLIIFLMVHFNIVNLLCETTAGKIIYLLSAIPLTLILSTKVFSFPTSHILKTGNSANKK